MIWNEQRILQTGTCFSSTANLWCFHHRYRRPPSGHLWDSRRADGCWVEGHGCHRGQVAVPHPGLGVSKKKNVFIMCKSTFCNFFDNMYIDYIYTYRYYICIWIMIFFFVILFYPLFCCFDFLTEVVFYQRPFAGIFLCNSAASRWNSGCKKIQVPQHHQLKVEI